MNRICLGASRLARKTSKDLYRSCGLQSPASFRTQGMHEEHGSLLSAREVAEPALNIKSEHLLLNTEEAFKSNMMLMRLLPKYEKYLVQVQEALAMAGTRSIAEYDEYCAEMWALGCKVGKLVKLSDGLIEHYPYASFVPI